MNFLTFLLIGFAFAFSGEAALTFYDYGTDHAYAVNMSRISEHIEQFDSYKFSHDDFEAGPYDILNGPVFIAYTPEDHVEIHLFYAPKGLSHVFDYNSYITPFTGDDLKFFLHFAKEIKEQYGNGFTPRAAEIAAPEFFFFNVTRVYITGASVDDIVPIVYLAPQHGKSEEFYLNNGFRKFADFRSLLVPFDQPFNSRPTITLPGIAQFLNQHPKGPQTLPNTRVMPVGESSPFKLTDLLGTRPTVTVSSSFPEIISIVDNE